MENTLTPEDQAVLDAAEAYSMKIYAAWVMGSPLGNLMDAVDARRKAREPKRCRCGGALRACGIHEHGEPFTGRCKGYVHVDTGIACCPPRYAEPDESPAVEAR